MCDSLFPLSFFLSLNRKTLQLDWTGASESLIFPQADFSGNCLSLLIFCQTLKSQLTRPTDFPCTSFFMISLQGLYVSMFYVCSHNSKTVHTYTHTHLDAALFSWSRVLLRRVCLRGSCSVFRSSHTSHNGAGLAWWAAGHRGGGITRSQMEKRNRQWQEPRIDQNCSTGCLMGF